LAQSGSPAPFMHCMAVLLIPLPSVQVSETLLAAEPVAQLPRELLSASEWSRGFEYRMACPLPGLLLCPRAQSATPASGCHHGGRAVCVGLADGGGARKAAGIDCTARDAVRFAAGN